MVGKFNNSIHPLVAIFILNLLEFMQYLSDICVTIGAGQVNKICILCVDETIVEPWFEQHIN